MTTEFFRKIREWRLKRELAKNKAIISPLASLGFKLSDESTPSCIVFINEMNGLKVTLS